MHQELRAAHKLLVVYIIVACDKQNSVGLSYSVCIYMESQTKPKEKKKPVKTHQNPPKSTTISCMWVCIAMLN